MIAERQPARIGSGCTITEYRQLVSIEPFNCSTGLPVTPDSIADGLSGPFAGDTALAVIQAHDVESMLVTEEEIEEAFRFLYMRAKLACEPAGAVAAAAVMAGRAGDGSIGVVVSGGNVAAQTASAILARQ